MTPEGLIACIWAGGIVIGWIGFAFFSGMKGDDVYPFDAGFIWPILWPFILIGVALWAPFAFAYSVGRQVGQIKKIGL